MKSISAFKNYMLHYENANYINRYCRLLNDLGWSQFYHQMKEPLEFISDEKYLFYILKWILKEPFKDLSYEVYVQVIMNPEQILEPLIKPQWRIILNQRYEDKYYELGPVSELKTSHVIIDNEFIF